MDELKLKDVPATASGIKGTVPKPGKKPESSRVVTMPSHDQLILTPAGPPPVKPKGFPWTAETKITDEEILAWGEEILAAGAATGRKFSQEAVVYFARYFWDIHSQEYLRVKQILMGA